MILDYYSPSLSFSIVHVSFEDAISFLSFHHNRKSFASIYSVTVDFDDNNDSLSI